MHAQTTAADVNTPLVTSPNSGVIIAEPSGRVQHLSKDAHRLLWIATHPGVTATQVYGGRHDNVLPEEVRRVYRKLVGVFKADKSAAPAGRHHRNPWGGFTLRACWLRDGDINESAPHEGTPQGEDFDKR
ncbi:MAG TPA: hypothetical protein VHJ19_12985 [Gammaproteobacteria bacterium]|nr:hypothetical protein [Gammaproteobacteria bacterium]